MPRLVKVSEAVAARRRVYFHLVDAADGLTPELGEAGGQPQVSVSGAAWTNTGIGTLSAIGNGRYYADLTDALLGTAGDWIETRYKSGNTTETPGTSFLVTHYDPVINGGPGKLIQAGETTAAHRRVFFHLVGTDGITPATGEAGGQPEISADGAGWTSTGIGALAAIGNGRYYAELSAAVVVTAGVWFETRYKSASTAECPGDSAFVVVFDPNGAPQAVASSIGASIEAALLTLLQAVSFDGITAGNTVAKKLPHVGENLDLSPPCCVLAAGAASETWDALSTETPAGVDYVYLWEVAFIKAGKRDMGTDNQVRLWLQQARRALDGEAGVAAVMAAAPTVWKVELRPAPLYDRGQLNAGYSYSGFTVAAYSAEQR